MIVASGYALAQTGPQNSANMHSSMPDEKTANMQDMHSHAMMMEQQAGLAGQPTLPGQDAFGAIQEIVRILEADPIPTGRRSTLKRCVST